jgi:hypothetical protein
MTLAFKIVSGHYHNLTYSDSERVTFSFKMLKESDIQFIVPMGGVSEADITYREYLLESKKEFSATYNGKSRIDGAPMFIINKNDARDIIIDELLN